MAKAKRTKRTEIRFVVLYLRVSDPRQAERDLSLPAQLAALKKYAADHGYLVVAIYEERGVTATDDARPQFRKMMADVLAPSADVHAILTYTTSRFMRNAMKAKVWKDRLRKSGVHVIAITQPVTDDPNGRLLEGMLESFDQFHSEMNSLATTAALRENARRGFLSNGKAPFGFRAVKVADGRNMRNRLEPEPSEVPAVKECLRAYVAKGGAKGAAKELHARGLTYRGKPFTKDRVLAVVSEEALIGTHYAFSRDSKTGEERPHDEWIPITCEAIVPRELWDMAQRVRAERDPVRNPGRTPSSPLLLAGLMSCGKCGAPFQLETSGKNSGSGVYAYRYANCRAHLRTGKHACEGARVRLELLEEAVRNHVAERLFTRERCEAIIRETVEGQGALRERTADHRRQLQRDLDEVEKRLTRYADAFETGKLDASVLTERVRELTVKRDELRATLAKVVPLRSLPPNLYAPAIIKRFQDGLRAAFLGDDQALAKTYCRTLLERVVIRDEHVQLIAKPDAVVQLIASGGKGSADPASAHSPTTAVSGLQLLDSNQRPGG